MRYVSFVGLFLSLLGMAACGDNARPIRQFYYPVDSLAEGRVYVYDLQTRGVDMPPRYYDYVVRLAQDDSVYLLSTRYEMDYSISQTRREKILPSGALLKDVRGYQPDSLGQLLSSRADIAMGHVFPFVLQGNANGILISELHMPDPSDSLGSFRLTHNRQYLRDTVWAFEGRRYPALLFGVREQIAYSHPEAGYSEYDSYTEEVFAEGWGLVAYTKNSFGNLATYALSEVIGMPELEARAAQSYGAAD